MSKEEIAKEFIEGTKDIDNGGIDYGKYGGLKRDLRVKMNHLAKGYLMIDEHDTKVSKALLDIKEQIEYFNKADFNTNNLIHFRDIVEKIVNKALGSDKE